MAGPVLVVRGLTKGPAPSKFIDKLWTILSTLFDHLVESFSYREVQFKEFYLPVKANCPATENVNKISGL